jgi:DNA replication protein DnaC
VVGGPLCGGRRHDNAHVGPCLSPALSFLRLKATAEALAEQLDQADGLSHIEFLERLLGVEVDATAARRHASLLRFACFPAPWRIEDFDYDAQPPWTASSSKSC